MAQISRQSQYVECEIICGMFLVAHLQQELVVAHKSRDDKLTESRRQAEDAAAAQRAAFDQKVSSACFFTGITSQLVVS